MHNIECKDTLDMGTGSCYYGNQEILGGTVHKLKNW